MEIRKYPKGIPPTGTQNLYKKGLLKRFPEQEERTDLVTDGGIDIVFHFKGVTSAVFPRVVDEILQMAYQEAERYSDEPYKHAKFTIEMDLNAKGRNSGMASMRDYIASKNSDSNTMIWGEGIDIPEGMKRSFLLDKAEEIINIANTDSPGPYLKRKTPYKVHSLTISIREGKKRQTEKLLQEAHERMAPKMAALDKKLAEKRRQEQEEVHVTEEDE